MKTYKLVTEDGNKNLKEETFKGSFKKARIKTYIMALYAHRINSSYITYWILENDHIILQGSIDSFNSKRIVNIVNEYLIFKLSS